MKKSTGTIVFLNRLLYTGIYSGMVLFCFYDLHGIYDVNWKHITVMLAAVVALSAVCLLHGRQQIYAAVLGAFVFFSLFLSIGSERCLVFFGRVLNSSSARGEIPTEEIIYIELGRVFLLAIVCCLIQFIVDKNIFFRITAADVVGGWLIYMRKAPKMGVVFFILYIGLIVAEWMRIRLKKMKHGSVQAYVLGIMPFLLVYAVLLCFMPMPDEPYDWQWAKNIYRRAEEKITMYTENLWYRGNEYFDGASSGFSEDGDLSGGIIRNDTKLITLGIGKHQDVSVYLAGKVFDSFNGHEWENRREGNSVFNGGRSGIRDDISESEKIMDVMETVYALRRYTGNLNPTYYSSIRMDVSYLYFHTNYLMAPSKTWIVENEDKKINYHYNGGNLFFDKKAGYGTEYTLQFCQLDMEREELYRFLEWNQGEDAEMWMKVVNQYTDEDIPIEKLYAYRDTMKEQYLPESDISPEIEEWIALVAANAKTDVEKLKYIESALSGMGYNTNPGKLPGTVTDESSFLDYFLLEKREGYCVHFATAFVLLARAEGFPARYVQGFCIPAVSGDETFVYSDMAHAWPEVYIEGKGWIPFEPTPGFGGNRYLPEQETADSDPGTVYTREPGSWTWDDEPEPASEMPEETTMTEDTPEEQNRWSLYLIRVVWVLLVGSVVFFAVDRLWGKYREIKRDLGEKYRLAVLHNLLILDMLGYKRKSSETYHELTERIRQCYANADEDGHADEDEQRVKDNEKDGNAIPIKFIEIYERILYGTLEIDKQILHEVLEEREQLLETLKKDKRKTYLLCRIRLYIMRYR